MYIFLTLSKGDRGWGGKGAAYRQVTGQSSRRHHARQPPEGVELPGVVQGQPLRLVFFVGSALHQPLERRVPPASNAIADGTRQKMEIRAVSPYLAQGASCVLAIADGTRKKAEIRAVDWPNPASPNPSTPHRQDDWISQTLNRARSHLATPPPLIVADRTMGDFASSACVHWV